MPSHDHLRRFQFIREIASGGFGSVFLTKVMHADGFSRLVAVKLLKSQWSDSDEVARRMRDEARLLGLLRHRNIVDVIDLTAIDGRAAVIMEYLEAVDLRTVVQNLAVNGHRLPVRAALEAASAVASALDAAYNRPPIPGDKPLRVIHRDIKPSNIMVDDTGMVKVLDFGVARSEIENRESHTQELQFGSVDYMAPERLFFEPETPSSDVYSLAATLFEILALEKFGKARGRPARHAAYVVDRLSFLRAGLSVGGPAATELEKLIGEGLAFNHEDRPTAAEFYQRARTLARMVDTDDLAGWSERVIPEMVQTSQANGPTDNPLAGKTLTEDPRAFGPGDRAPESQSAGSADILRQGALAEMEDTGAFVPSPQTGAPAQLHGRAAVEPDPEEDWDDGPTAVGGLKGPVRVPRPGNSEEARMMQSGSPKRQAPVLPDPSDPFAQLVRSPLSPPKTPTAQPKKVETPAAPDDGDTEVADALQPPVVPVKLPSTGHYDPSAPEADGPLPPLPAPPGVTARPLEPVMPEPVQEQKAAPPPVVPSPSAVEPASQPPVVPPPGVEPQSSSPPVVPPPDAVVSDQSSAPPVVPPPRAVFDDEPGFDEFEATEVVVPSASAPSQPAVIGPPAAVAEAEPEPPSLDDVVPQSPESRYGPELERLKAAEDGAGVPVIPEYEPSHDAVSAPPSLPPTVEAEPAVHIQPDRSEVDEPAPKKSSKAPLFAAAGCFVFVLMGGAAVGGAYTMGLIGGGEDTVHVVPDATDAVADEAVDTGTKSAEDDGDNAVPDGTMQVRSGMENTRKISVSCGGGVKESGDSSVLVPADAQGPCRVKVILDSRKRLNGQIDAPAPGTMVCFAGGSDTCAME